MTQARIYPLSKSVGQSGQFKSGQWVLEMERTSSQSPESVMGWTQSGDTLNQIKMNFSTSDEAKAFAKSQGWMYTMSHQNQRKVKPRNYGQNFEYKAEEN